ncbi:MAG: heme A synthase [Terriglobales bacterium]
MARRCSKLRLYTVGTNFRPAKSRSGSHPLEAEGGSPRSTDLKPLSTPYNRAHHWFAVFTAATTFLLIIAGALVTSNDAGLAVPDWPTSFGHWPVTYSYFEVPMVGGIMYEHGHRIVAQFIGVLTIILAIWTWRRDRRPWLRTLGIAALGTVIIQGVLGGITVLKFLPPVVSTAHAAVGQTFFCIAVAIALFTGRRWVGEEPQTRVDTNRPSLPVLAWLSVAAVYVQLILGAMFRHNGMKLLPHLISAVIVTAVLSWTITRTLSRYGDLEQLRRPAIMLLALLLAQLSLGFTAYLTRVVWGQDAVQPSTAMVVTTVAHVAVGALLLATTVVLAIQAWRHMPVLHEERVPGGTQKAVTA